MQILGPKDSLNQARGFTIVRPATPGIRLSSRNVVILVTVFVVSNLITFAISHPITFSQEENTPAPRLYLLDKASLFVPDIDTFEEKVIKISKALNIAPEWLMAVMYSESKFDAAVRNHRGSGAVGLIQWMPGTAAEMQIGLETLRQLPPTDQLDYVFDYLSTVRRRYGDFENLTDLYLAILYPKALDMDYCFSMYEKPSKTYRINRGLDENKDGRVTVSDIDKRMKRIYPTAYLAKPRN
ncbi:MAG: transglycosylase SLT domain-containing protein [Bacteroidota bacterium]